MIIPGVRGEEKTCRKLKGEGRDGGEGARWRCERGDSLEKKKRAFALGVRGR